MNLVAVYNRQPAIRSSGLLRGALVTAQRSGDGKSDRFLVLELDNSLIRKFRATHPRPLPGLSCSVSQLATIKVQFA